MGRDSTTKRRGRPLSSSPSEDAALKARRERNREAQNVFRKRRQAAEAAQVQRLRRLEEVVEEMSSVFMSFVDEMLQIETVRLDPRLVGSLGRATKKMVALANEVVGPEDESGAGGVIVEMAKEGDGPSPQLQAGLDMDVCPSYPSSYPSPAASGSETAPQLIHQPIDTRLSLQIYGNGWQDFPRPPETPPSINPSDLAPLPPLDVDSFAYRLVKATMTTAYLVLSRAPHPPIQHSEEQRIFGSTLRFRSREELLSRMRYLLGPGTRDLSYAAHLPYGRWGESLFSRHELSSVSKTASTSIPGIDKFLSVTGVEKQLLSLGARIVDSETLELNISSQHPASVPSMDAVDMSDTQLDTWSFVDFFSPGQPQPNTTALTMRLSISLLVADLSRRAVCLLRGPGFPRSELGMAIEASIITAAGGDTA